MAEIDVCIRLCLISETIQTKSKKSKSAVTRRVVPPLQLDSMGRPIFPLVIGDLTLHSLGEVSINTSHHDKLFNASQTRRVCISIQWGSHVFHLVINNITFYRLGEFSICISWKDLSSL